MKSLRNAYFITTFFWRKYTNKSIYLKSLYSTRDFLCAPAAPFFSCHVLNSKINDYYSHQMTFLITLRIIFLPVLIIIIWGGRYLLAGSRTCSHFVSSLWHQWPLPPSQLFPAGAQEAGNSAERKWVFCGDSVFPGLWGGMICFQNGQVSFFFLLTIPRFSILQRSHFHQWWQFSCEEIFQCG